MSLWLTLFFVRIELTCFLRVFLRCSVQECSNLHVSLEFEPISGLLTQFHGWINLFQTCFMSVQTCLNGSFSWFLSLSVKPAYVSCSMCSNLLHEWSSLFYGCFRLFFISVYTCCICVQTCDGVQTCFMGFKPSSWVFKSHGFSNLLHKCSSLFHGCLTCFMGVLTCFRGV